jgi:hypothetical protein
MEMMMKGGEGVMGVKPILFNSDMVNAILDGRKTVTRRIVKPQPTKEQKYFFIASMCGDKEDYLTFFFSDPFGKSILHVKRPYNPADILYVREAYCPNYFDESIAGYRGDLRGNRNAYKADYHTNIVGNTVPEPKWHPSIHMPKEAARIWLKVTDVRMERLQDITEEQAQAEGCMSGMLTGPCAARQQFEEIWDSTIKKSDLDRYGWDANPYVWVIEFDRCEKL